MAPDSVSIPVAFAVGSAVSSTAASLPSSNPSEDAAVTKLQALARGHLTRKHEKQLIEALEHKTQHKQQDQLDCPFVPTPTTIISSFLSLTPLSANDSLLDLGCGDGRVCMAAVQQTCVGRAIGVDHNGKLVSRAEAVKDKLTHEQQQRVQFVVEEIQSDTVTNLIRQATVLFVYLTPPLMLYLERLLISLASSSPQRIVTYMFQLSTCQSDQRVTDRRFKESTLYLYRTPLRTKAITEGISEDIAIVASQVVDESFIELHSSQIRPFLHQVAGHQAVALAMQSYGECLLKPMHCKSVLDKRARVERAFYEYMMKQSNHPLRWFLVDYCGCCRLVDRPQLPYLMLCDLTYSMSQPHILDLKMGLRTFDEDATVDKIAKETGKFVLQRHLGFRVCGQALQKQKYNKEWGRTRNTRDAVQKVLDEFFHTKHLRIEAKQKMQALFKVMSQPSFEFRFYAASLLFVYDQTQVEHTVTTTHDSHSTTEIPSEEADLSQPVELTSHERSTTSTPRLEMKLIDMTHSYGPHRADATGREKRPDQSGFLFGLETLISMINTT